MGKRSVRENKTPYQLAREACGLTREQASEKMEYVSADRIEKIENERISPGPDDVMAMAKAYNDTLLCNYYCSEQCLIGREYVPAIEIKNLSEITLEALSTLNALEKARDRFIDIAADSRISPDEMEDFLDIRDKLEKIALTADSLRYWMDRNLPDAEK